MNLWSYVAFGSMESVISHIGYNLKGKCELDMDSIEKIDFSLLVSVYSFVTCCAYATAIYEGNQDQVEKYAVCLQASDKAMDSPAP